MLTRRSVRNLAHDYHRLLVHCSIWVGSSPKPQAPGPSWRNLYFVCPRCYRLVQCSASMPTAACARAARYPAPSWYTPGPLPNVLRVLCIVILVNGRPSTRLGGTIYFWAPPFTRLSRRLRRSLFKDFSRLVRCS